MNRLVKIVTSASSGTSVQLRREAYGAANAGRFLRDVLAMANAAVEGPRYIVVGAEADASGRKRYHAVGDEDFSGKPSYQALVTDFIEPPVRVRYTPVTIEGKRIGVFEIPECHDKPYMMRIDHSETLRRGDAYARVNDAAVKLGRRQLQDMFSRKFREAVAADTIEIGFPGEIIHKNLELPTVDLGSLPSAIASEKLRQIIDIRTNSRNTGATTVMARLTHARLFGTDSPYEDRSPVELIEEMAQIRRKHEDDDAFYLFEQCASEVQLVLYNQGDDALRDASLSIVLPNHAAFYVADRLPRLRRDGRYVERTAAEQDAYPSVSLRDDAVHVSVSLADVAAGELVRVFPSPLRVCAGSELRGRRFGLRYALFAANLREPARGTLRLLF